MSDEVVIDEGVSPYGLARIHVICMDRPVDLEKWIHEKVNSGTVEAFYRYQEDDLGLHHLRLYWRPERNELASEAAHE